MKNSSCSRQKQILLFCKQNLSIALTAAAWSILSIPVGSFQLKKKNCNFIKFFLDATFSFSYCLIFFFNLKLNFLKKKYCCYSNASHLVFFEPILHRFLLSQYSHNKNANALFVAKHISHFLVLLVCNQFFSFALLFIFT